MTLTSQAASVGACFLCSGVLSHPCTAPPPPPAAAAEIASFLVAEGLLGAAAVAAAPPAPSAEPNDQQRAQLAALVLREAATLAGGDANFADADAPLMSAGLTSTLAVQLVAALEEVLSAELPGTLVFDYPTGAFATNGVASCDKRWARWAASRVCRVHLPDPPCLQPCALVHALPCVLHPCARPHVPVAAAEIADFLLSEGLVQAAPAALPAPTAAAALVAATELGSLPAPARPLCAITGSAHSVPGGQLAFQPGTTGNDRITPVPLERWDVELAPADAPTGRRG